MTIIEDSTLCLPDVPNADRAVTARPAARLSELDEVLNDVGGLIGEVFDRIGWAEEEIEAAQLRHGERGRGPLWNSFRLLRMTNDQEWPELLFRAHCRELLDRVAAGIDTRPATDAEKISVLSAASQVAPLNSGAETLYLRLGSRMLPGIFDGIGDVLDMEAYETVHGNQADEYEALLTRKLAQPWRRIGATAEEIDQLLIAPHE